MTSSHTRRQTLRYSVVVGSASIAGCLFSESNEAEVGSIGVFNDDSVNHTVTLTITETTRSMGTNEAETPTQDEIVRVFSRTITVEAGGRTPHDFIDEQGVYYIEVEVDDGRTGATWFATAGSEQPGNVVLIDIDEDLLSVGTGSND